MSDTQKLALMMMADPDLAEKDWPQVVKDQVLRPEDRVSGESFCALMYQNWINSRMALLIGAGDDVALAAFIETVDPKRLVRGK